LGFTRKDVLNGKPAKELLRRELRLQQKAN